MAEKKVPFDQKVNAKPDKTNTTPKKKRSAIKITLLVLLLLLLAGGGVAAAVLVGYIEEAPPLDPARLATLETSYLYDSSGEEITALHEEQNRIVVSLTEIPLHVRQAFIAIEDERFHDHFGFDIVGSFRAAYANFRAGTIVQGASTISQQLAQNAFLTTETSYERKIQEIYLAIQMERVYAKEEILEMYLNRIYFGNGAYGVEAAAQTYFDKSVGELNVSEAAMLAGAVRSPNFYNPFDNQAEAETRMRLVLSSMNRLEMISADEYEEAINRPLSYAVAESEEYPYPHFVDYVVHDELIRILSGIPSIGSREEAYRAIYTGGLRVYTTLKPEMQRHVESVLGQTELYPTTVIVNMPQVKEAIAALPANRDLTRAQLEELVDEEGGVPQPQAAIVLADPVTGQIQALGGGREYRKKVDEVLRFRTLRQPGSAIKPITTYGPAFEEGTLGGAGSTLDDSPYIGPQDNWFPENFDYRFRGFITAREALYFSYNIPAIRAFEELGTQTGFDYARKMGLSTLQPAESENLALTLGGLYSGVSAIDMAQAYSVFANDGVKIDLHTVEKVVDRQGEVLYENRSNPRQVLSPQAAFLVNDILQDFVTRYLGRALQIDRPVAAKTGTTDDWRDVYLVAYTPNLVASFWMGYDEPRMGRIQQGWRYSTEFLRSVFLEAFEDLEIQDFERPEGIVRISVCSRSGKLPNSTCEAAGTVVSDYFIAGQEPTGSCDMHEGRFYNRPPYIITDERWSTRGGPGRGPEDADEIPPDPSFVEMAEQRGQTTSEITLFNAYVTEDGVTLQWEYDGPEVAGFTLTRNAHAGSGQDKSIELNPSSRQHSDSDTELNSTYSYRLAAVYPGGQVSEAAVLLVSTAGSPGEGIGLQPDASGPVVVPDVRGKFLAIAELEISRAGLKVGNIEQRHDDTVRINRIIEQVPAPGTVISSRHEVSLVVSRGAN